MLFISVYSAYPVEGAVARLNTSYVIHQSKIFIILSPPTRCLNTSYVIHQYFTEVVTEVRGLLFKYIVCYSSVMDVNKDDYVSLGFKYIVCYSSVMILI